jgi:hypothetical protein
VSRFFLLVLLAATLLAQDNYEIQVYPAELVDPHATMVELHSNFTVDGYKQNIDGVRPTNHAEHETVEITHGFNDWYETGAYVFTSARSGDGLDWVGCHLRPRIRAPQEWKWPVGVSLSTEFGYVRPAFSADTWTIEVRPIVDQKAGPWYWAFNPTLDRSVRGQSVKAGWEFSPNVKLSYDVTRIVSAGFEYYGSLGPVAGFDPLREQQQQLFPAVDLNLSPKWEFNLGVGVGMTHSTDHLIVKMILGYRFKL